MTPPTTPPTTSEIRFSYVYVSRAVAAHNKGWKKMGARLGFSSRKSSTRKSTPTSTRSSGRDSDVMSSGEITQVNSL